jgi:hypothetical protein
MLKIIYTAIEKRLKKSMTDLGEIDWYLQQDQMIQNNFQYITPAVYLRFEPLDMETLGRGVQQASLKFAVIHVTEVLTDQWSKRISDVAVRHHERDESIYTALHEWNSFLSYVPGFGNLEGTEHDLIILNSISRTQLVPNHSFSKLLRTEQHFGCEVFDHTGHIAKMKKNPNLDLNLS